MIRIRFFNELTCLKTFCIIFSVVGLLLSPIVRFDCIASPISPVNSEGTTINNIMEQNGVFLNLQFDFGKAQYSDNDGNGFDDATILGYGVGLAWNFREKWSLWTSFTELNSFDALTVYPGYEKLDPTVTSDRKGTLTNKVLDGGVAYRFGKVGFFDRMELGLGWLTYDFIAKEHGFLEKRDYQGLEILLNLDKKLNRRLAVKGRLKLAPSLEVSDSVRGDWNNPDRTANASYQGSFWAAQWGFNIALNEKMWLESGFSYQQLSGDGDEHPEYRFLDHDYIRYGFYILWGTKVSFNGRNAPESSMPEVEEANVSEPIIQYPAVTITKVTPNEGMIDTQADLRIEGTGFRSGIKAVLVKDQSVLEVTNLKLVSETQISGSVALNKEIGLYDLRVTNDDGQFSELSKAFTVKEPESIAPRINFSPRQGFNNGSILITIEAADVVPGMAVKLVNPTGVTIPGEIIGAPANEIRGFFDLKGKPVGLYELYCLYPDGHYVKAEDNFEVLEYSMKNGQAKTLAQVFFDVNKADLESDQINKIKNSIAILLRNPASKIILGGYTDSRGSYSYNLALSMRRAEAVRLLLVANGIKPEQISIYAYGKEYAQEGRDETVWQNDRRVEIVAYEVSL